MPLCLFTQPLTRILLNRILLPLSSQKKGRTKKNYSQTIRIVLHSTKINARSPSVSLSLPEFFFFRCNVASSSREDSNFCVCRTAQSSNRTFRAFQAFPSCGFELNLNTFWARWSFAYIHLLSIFQSLRPDARCAALCLLVRFGCIFFLFKFIYCRHAICILVHSKLVSEMPKVWGRQDLFI